MFMASNVYLERKRIKELLEKALQKPIVCISAGAGYGKTSCIQSYTKNNNIHTAWVQISLRDNLAERFWENFLYAFSQINKKNMEKLRMLGFPSTGELYARYLSILKTSLIPGEKYLFVYDDVHLLENPDLLRFIELSLNSSIFNLGTVLIYRWEPELNIKALINRKTASLIKEADLCFTKEEMLSYYKLQNLSLSPATASRVYKDTEGWAFAIHLAGISLKNTANVSYIPQALKANINKLIKSEIIDNLSGELRHTLIKLTLIEELNRKLVKEIINDVSLEKMILKMSFLINHDTKQNIYHIHHLFKEYLKDLQYEIKDEEKTELFNRASRWCIGNNKKMDAIMYCQKAGNLQGIMDIFYSLPLLLSRQTASYILSILDSLNKDVYGEYIQAIVMRNRAMASLRLFDQSRKETLEKLPLYLAMPESLKKNTILVVCYVNLASIDFVNSVYTRNYDFVSYFKKAAHYAKIAGLATKAPLNGDILSSYVCRVAAPASKTIFLDYIGMLKAIVPYSMEAMGGCRSGLYELALGEYAFYCGKYNESLEHLRQSLKKASEKQQYEIENRSLFYILRIYLYQGDKDKIKSIMLQLKKELDEVNFPNRHSYYDLVTGYYFIQTGEFEKIAPWIKNEYYESNLVSAAELLIKFIQAKYLFAVKKYPAAIALINSRIAEEPLLLGELELKTLEAVCHFRQKNREKAYKILKTVYDLAKESGITTVFTEHGKDMRSLLENAAMDKVRGIPLKWLETIRLSSVLYAKKLYPLKNMHGSNNTVLSGRENEILKLICQGLTRNEIANSFSISPNTVKTVIKSIYNKLGAANKADAVRIAEERKF